MKNKILKASSIIAGVLGNALVSEASDESSSIPQLSDDLNSIQVGNLNNSLPIYLAAHRSHQSHASHGSHRSSSTPTAPRRAPAPTFVVPPAPQPAEPATNDPLGQPPRPDQSVPGNNAFEKQQLLNQAMTDADKLKNIIMRVQLTLQILGFFDGSIDGVMGPTTREAINEYRVSKDIPTSEKLDVITLDSLGILVY